MSTRRWIYAIVASVLCASAALCLIYTNLHVFPSRSHPEPSERSSSTNARSTSCRRMCTTKDCILTAAELLTSMDHVHTDPCVDFHSYSCGNLPPQLPDESGNIPSLVEQSMLIDIRNVINEITEDEIKPVRQLKQMYDNCVNFKSAEEMVIPAFLKMLARAGLSGWPKLPDDWTFQTGDGKRVSIDFVLSQLHLMRSHNFLRTDFEVPENRTFKSTTGKIGVEVSIKVSGSMPMKYAHLSPETYAEDLKSYKELMQNILDILGVKPEDIEKQIFDILQLEKDISFWLNQTDPYDLKDFVTQSLSDSEWGNYTQQLLHSSGISSDAVDVQILSYRKSFRNMIESYSNKQIANYLAYRFVKGILEDFGFFFRGFFPSELNLRSFTMHVTDFPKWKECVIRLSFFMEPVMSYWYMVRRLEENTLSTAENIYHSIHNITYSIIEDISWLNETSKSEMKNIVASTNSPFENFMPYSNASFIEKLYESLDLQEDTNFGISAEFEMFKNRDRLKSKLIEGRKPLIEARGLLAANAMVSYEGKVSVGLGLLRSPFFSATRPNLLNIGMFGTMLAHELVHVLQLNIDNTILGVDESGNWITFPEELQEYKHCVTTHYNNYKFQFVNQSLMSNASFREDFADLLGTEIAYRAYRHNFEQNGDEFGVLRLNVTEDQLFFILFAQYYCQPMNENTEKMIISLGASHSPNKFRVLGTASNLRHFAKAFKCSDNSPMNPSEKCSFLN